MTSYDIEKQCGSLVQRVIKQCIFEKNYGDELGKLLIHLYLRMCEWIRDACLFGECKCVCEWYVCVCVFGKCVCVIGEMYKIQY